MTSAVGVPIGPRPTSPEDAVDRAIRLLGSGGVYALGTGNYRPVTVGGVLRDLPWTQRESDGLVGCDCAGLICWAYKLPRHRPGFNKGGAYDCEDDLNSNSFLGDASGAQDLFSFAVDFPTVGDVIAYPTFRLAGVDRPFIGHVAIVVGTSRFTTPWSQELPCFAQLDIVQVCGPDRRSPAAVSTDGSLFDHHNERWPKDEHRAWLLRVVP